jgi:hypothetical protein
MINGIESIIYYNKLIFVNVKSNRKICHVMVMDIKNSDILFSVVDRIYDHI